MPIRTFADVVNLWPSPTAMADDLMDVTVITTRSWRHRRIPSEYWCELMAAANRRRLEGLSYELLARLAARPRPERPELRAAGD